MGRLDGKVAFITGVARGQGRSHALRLAEEGAAVIGVDICDDITTDPRPLATPADLEETGRLLAERGARALLRRADVRESDQLAAVVAEGVERFGPIDTVMANAGVGSRTRSWELSEEAWRNVLDVNLTGAWLTARAAIPSMIDGGRGGSIMFTSSVAALKANGNLSAYSAAKTGLMGLARELALELAPHGIRVNTIHPTSVDTMMINNDYSAADLFPGRTFGSAAERSTAVDELFRSLHILPVGLLDVSDISDTVVFLASDESRMLTAENIRVDAGFAAR